MKSNEAEISDESDFWESDDGPFFLKVAQNTIADSLGLPLRILHRDAIDRVSAGLMSKFKPPGVNKEKRKDRFIEDIVNRLPNFPNSNDGLARFLHEVEVIQESAEKWGIRGVDKGNPPITEGIEGTDIDALWDRQSSEWMWRTQPSNTHPFHRVLSHECPSIHQLCRIYILSLATKLTERDSTVRDKCIFGMDVFLLVIPQGILLAGPMWTRSPLEPAEAFEKRVEHSVTIMETMDKDVGYSRHSLYEQARSVSTHYPRTIENKIKTTKECLQLLDKITRNKEISDLIRSLPVPGWVRLVQFIVFIFSERFILRKLSSRNSGITSIFQTKPVWKFYYPLSRNITSAPCIGFEGDQDSIEKDGFKIFHNKDEAINKGYEQLIPGDHQGEESEISRLAYHFFEEIERNKLFAEHNLITYISRPFRKILKKDPQDQTQALLHRLLRIVEGDFAAFLWFDPSNKKMTLTDQGFFGSLPYGTTRLSRNPSQLASIKDNIMSLESILIDAVAKDTAIILEGHEIHDALRASGVLSILAVPARHMGRTIGIYALGGLRVSQFGKRSQDALFRVGHIVSPYLFRARLYSGMHSLNDLITSGDANCERGFPYDAACAKVAEIFSNKHAALWLNEKVEAGYSCFRLQGLAGSWDGIEMSFRGTLCLEQKYIEGISVVSVGRNGTTNGATLEPIGWESMPLGSYAVIPIPSKFHGTQGILLLHDDLDSVYYPAPAQGLLELVAEYFGVIVESVRASFYEKQTLMDLIRHEVRGSLLNLHSQVGKTSGMIERMLSGARRISEVDKLIRSVCSDMESSPGASDYSRNLSREILKTIDSTGNISNVNALWNSVQASLKDLESNAKIAINIVNMAKIQSVKALVQGGHDPRIALFLLGLRQQPLENPLDPFNELMRLIKSKKFPEGVTYNVDGTGFRKYNQLWLYKEQFDRVVDNLLDNARKYSSNDSVVDISVTKKSAAITIDVESAGCPISNKEQKSLFDYGFRGNVARESEKGGEGKGLFFARGIARQWGGDVRYFCRGKYNEKRNLDRHLFQVNIPLFRFDVNTYESALENMDEKDFLG